MRAKSITMYCLLSLCLPLPVWAQAECDAVAVVFNTAICQGELTNPDQLPGAKQLSPEKQLAIKKLRLGQRIRAIAACHLLPAGSYTPSEQEVNVFTYFSARAKANHTREQEAVVVTVEHLLATYEYTDRHRNRLEETLAVFKRGLEQSKRILEDERRRDQDMRKRFGEDAVKKLHLRIQRSRRKISEHWVARWKMNKALYEKYGGRVIFQQAGIEPIDAYRRYLQDTREQGGLKILKPAYADVFESFERYLDMGHNYLSAEGKTYFDRPYWETADPGAGQRRHLQELKAIPHKSR